MPAIKLHAGIILLQAIRKSHIVSTQISAESTNFHLKFI